MSNNILYLIISIFYKLDVWRNPEILGRVLFILSSVNDFSDISSSFNQFLLEDTVQWTYVFSLYKGWGRLPHPLKSHLKGSLSLHRTP